ncbi:MAG: 23S rRNA (uracil(1939)-C(5))-methyltransferase RlmD [Gemmatimonadota bacterium]
MPDASDPGCLVLTVDSIAVGGEGVARDDDGRVVFVPRTAPGDRVRARVLEAHPTWARAGAVEILAPGPDRRTAPCPHYERCGGCQLQHLEPAAQEAARRAAVADTLERIGGRDVEVEPIVAPGPQLGYRNRVSLTLRRGEGASVTAGYHVRDDPARLLDVDRCPLAEEPVNAAWRALREAWGPGARRLPSGAELRLTLRATHEGSVGLLVEGGELDGSRKESEASELLERVDELSSLHWRPEAGPLRRLAGAKRLEERWQGIELSLHPAAFLQVNRTVAARMEDHLDGLMGEVSGVRILDLYAGVGLRAMRWSERGADAVACEVHPGAVETGRRTARRHGVDVDMREGSVEEHVEQLLPADTAVVNPPRQGLSPEVAGSLGAAELAALAYVSCDPATLARDLKRLGEAWRVESVQPFDAFPQTAHVETIVWLTRPDGTGARG